MVSRIRLIALGLVASLAGAGTFVAACSSDDTVTSADAGNDVGIPPPPPGDDTGDANMDAGNDSAMFDGGVNDFVDQLTVALCHSAARCCFGSTDPPDGSIDAGDGGTGSFNKAKCLQIYGANGWEGSNRYMSQTDASTLTLDTVKAAACINGVENVSCTVSGTDLATLRNDCYGAFHGSQPIGATCSTALDCAVGEFCNGDGGAPGTCAALRGDGGPCGDFTTDLNRVDEACSWRGAGGDQYCQIFSDFASATLADAGDWHCEPAKGIGGDCNSDGWCTAASCDFNTFVCTSPENVYPAAFCAEFVK